MLETQPQTLKSSSREG